MAQLNVGSNKIRLVFIGSTDISKIYVGSSLVFQRSDSKTIPNNLTTYSDIYNAVSALGMTTQQNVTARNGELYFIRSGTAQSYGYVGVGNTTYHLNIGLGIALYFIVSDDAGYLYIYGGDTRNSAYWIKKLQATGSGSNTNLSVKATYNR